MVRRILASRGLMSLILILAAVATVVGGVRVLRPHPAMQTYCADMPDAIGLYQGSTVTILGIPVGHVTNIHSHGNTARVEFSLPADQKLSTDVGATTLSDTLVADRRLAVITTPPGSQTWDPRQCITKTLTPKSLSETFTALAGLADELNGSDDPQHPRVLGQGVAALDAASAGTGQQINSILQRLGVALSEPDAAIGHLGGLIDAVSSLANSAATYWPQVKDMLTRLAAVLDQMNNVAIPLVLTFMDKLGDILPALNNITVIAGGSLVRGLAGVQNLPQLIQTGVSGLHDLVTMLPALDAAFTATVDPVTKIPTVAYAPPHIAVPEPDAAQVCSALDAITPGACTGNGNGLIDLPLTQLVLGSVGDR